jgi:hypothetical protein
MWWPGPVGLLAVLFNSIFSLAGCSSDVPTERKPWATSTSIEIQRRRSDLP